MTTNTAPILEMTGITKSFTGVRALEAVDFRLRPGEVHALLGENGAGKSTLLKVLTGVMQIDAGRIELKGQPVHFAHPLEAQHAGISAVYQEVNLCPNLCGQRNLYIGREPASSGASSGASARRRAVDALERVDVHVDVSALLSTHSLAVQQMVAIARAIDISAEVLILDEPTSSLDRGEVDQLFTVIRQLVSRGIAVVFVSHFLDQVYEIADRVTVLRNGRLVGEWRAADLTRVELVTKMLGRELTTLEELERKPRAALDSLEQTTPVLEAKAVGRKRSSHLSTSHCIAAKSWVSQGCSVRDNRSATDSSSGPTARTPASSRSRARRWRSGAADRDCERRWFCPENRRTEGLIEDLTVRENIVLALQASTRVDAFDPAQAPGRARGALGPGPGHPNRRRRAGSRHCSAGATSKGSCCTLADHVTEIADPRRADERHRRWRETEIHACVSLCDDGVRRRSSGRDRRSASLSHKVAVLRYWQIVAELANDGITVDTLLQTIAEGQRLTSHRLIWPLLSIGALLLTNLFVSPGFF